MHSEIKEYKQQRKIIKVKLDNVTTQIGALNEEKLELLNRLEELDSKIAKAHVLQLTTAASQSSCQYNQAVRFCWSNELDRVLKDVFHIDEFRSLQLRAINALLDGNDVLLVMPTGAGKSIVYQSTAFIDTNAFKVNDKHLGSVTLVISPLISLITDQIINLRQYDLESDAIATLDSNTPQSEQKRILSLLTDNSNKANAKHSSLRLLYITPEKLAKSKLLMNRLETTYAAGRLGRIAIDEVHCASQWGHDFRPDYKFLHVLRRQFPSVPIVGLTATASTELIVDVQKMLGLAPERCLVLRAGYNRPNLNYQVYLSEGTVKNSTVYLFELIKSKYDEKCGIVYCLSQKDTEDVAKDLKTCGIKAAPYHAYLDFNYRSKVHADWTKGLIHIIVATVAFGMGINKPDVRFVIHFSTSKSLENYYQESGRAGRDGRPADCIVIWRFTDLFRLASMVSSELAGVQHLWRIISYCTNPVECRRYLIARHLDDASWTRDDCNQACDNCRRDKSRIFHLNITNLLRQTYNLIDNKAIGSQERLTGPKLVDLMHANRSMEETVRTLLCQTVRPPKTFYEHVVAWALVHNYLKIDFHYTPYSTICYMAVGDKQRRPTTGDQSIISMPYFVPNELHTAKSTPMKGTDGATYDGPAKKHSKVY